MSLSRVPIEEVFVAACRACDPEAAVAAWLREPGEPVAGARRFGIAIGKAAVAMARGAGPVHRGIAVTVEGGDRAPVPAGWQVIVASHPVPDERSVAAAHAVIEVVEAAGPEDLVLALVSGGASALVELPLVPLAELVALTGALMARGAPIGELNTVRSALSAIKAGGLALRSRAPIVTLIASDVIGDDVRVVGSGPTIADAEAPRETPADAANDNATHVANDNADDGVNADATDRARTVASQISTRRAHAREILARHELAIPAILTHEVPAAETRAIRSADRVHVVLPMSRFVAALVAELATDRPITVIEQPLAGEVATVAQLVASRIRALDDDAIVVAWGEPTVAVPDDHGEGGRAQQLALLLARELRGTDRSALVIGSDGRDGPAPRDRPAPAGAFVDGATWARLGERAEAALARCDAGTVLHEIGALVVTGPTGINHADVVIVG